VRGEARAGALELLKEVAELVVQLGLLTAALLCVVLLAPPPAARHRTTTTTTAIGQ
jgi:hypothetical protein